MRGIAVAVLIGVLCNAAPGARAQPSAAPASGQTCVDVTIGGDRGYGCLNAQLEKLARQAHRAAVIDALGADSPAPEIGLANETATRERMGSAFGHSAYVVRPPLNAGPVSPLFPNR